MSVHWKDDHTSIILSMMRDRPCLWDISSKHYRDRGRRDAALSEIVDELNIRNLDIEKLKLKIKSIRTRYSKELGDVLKSHLTGTCASDIYVPKLFWFKEADSFLRAVCSPRSTSSRIQGHIEEHNMQGDDGFEIIVPSSDMNGHIEPESPEHDDDPDEYIFENDCSTPTKKCVVPVKRRLEINIIKKAIDKLQKITEERAIRVVPEHEFDIFCQSLAVQLKKMPLDRALICQQKLQEVMTEERLYQYKMEESAGQTITSDIQPNSHSCPTIVPSVHYFNHHQ